MGLVVLIVLAIAVALAVFSARPRSRKLRRASDRPRLWESTSAADSAALFALAGSESRAPDAPGSMSSPHDDGFHSSTNAPSDGGGTGGHGGDGDGGGH